MLDTTFLLGFLAALAATAAILCWPTTTRNCPACNDPIDPHPCIWKAHTCPVCAPDGVKGGH